MYNESVDGMYFPAPTPKNRKKKYPEPINSPSFFILGFISDVYSLLYVYERNQKEEMERNFILYR